jgi:flagellar operon protein
MADTRIIFQPIMPLENHLNANNRNNGNTVTTGASFADILAGATQKVSFSNHALQRMESRNLNLTDQDLQKLDDTVAKMAQKGAKESLIYMNDMALVVSVPNRKVITAMDGNSARENIFTNIDSAAII